MLFKNFKLGCLFLIVALLATNAVARSSQNEEWAGKIQDDSLQRLAPDAGYISNAETWSKVWNSWRPDEEVPKIDFETHLVLVGTVPGPNLVLMRPQLDDEGQLKFQVGGTKIGGPGFGYKLIKFPREGVQTVNGEALADEGDGEPMEESISVNVVGKLKTGIVAIGGETTGTTITAKGITWELDFGDRSKLSDSAQQLNGQLVRVEGQLERRQGIEVGDRWIVHVTKLVVAK